MSCTPRSGFHHDIGRISTASGSERNFRRHPLAGAPLATARGTDLSSQSRSWCVRHIVLFCLIHVSWVSWLPLSGSAQEEATGRKAAFQQALDRGAAHLQRREKDQALKELKGAVALDPRSAAAHQLLGQAYMMQGSYGMLSEARAEFLQALAINPDLVWSRFYLARIYLDLGVPRKAREQLESALATRPNVPHLLSLLGEANRQLGNLELSVELNKRALENDPSFFIAHYYLGLAYMDLDRESDGIRELEAAIKPEYPAAEIYLT